MRIRAAAPDHPRAWEVVAPPGTTVAALAAAAGLPRASHYALGGRAVAATVSLEQAGMADGALLAPLGAPPAPAAVALVVVDGPRAGQVWPLAAGRHHVGRHPSMDVLLDDPDVAACHAELCIGTDGSCSVRDRGSATGTWIDGRRIEHAVVLDHGTGLRIGGTTFRVQDATRAAPAAPRDGTPRHRPPRRLPSPAPAPPEPVPPFAPPPAAATPRGLLSMLVPSLAGVAVAGAVHPSLLPLAAVAPIGATATWSVLRALDVRARRTARAAHAELVRAHETAAARHDARLVRRLVERHPDLGEIACRVRRGDERLWERRAPHDDFLRLAVGTLGGAPAELDLRAPVGIVGPRAAAVGVARALVVQLAAHHGPADCAITGCTGGALEWRWLDWLPHPTDAGTPARVLVVDLAAAGTVDRATWRAHVASGGTAIVVAPRRADLPEECATVVEITGRAARVTRTTTADPEDVEHVWTISTAVADDLAAALAPLRDADATAGATDLPGEVRLLDHRPATEVAERWRSGRRRTGLAMPLGVGPDGPLLLDLVADGPHGLIAGTTGAGKSELLRTVVASLAASYDTARVAFVLVDYKGGSAFDGLAPLPHVVDVVTDLDIATARRAIAGLEAEVHRRERLLREIGVRDIAELHARDRDPAGAGTGAGDPAFPRLVIVVDEFATLAQDLPEFVDALVDVAQRGRSLGVHLLLATQRPSGAVKDAIRTNTNIRIALRVLDAADSRDVLGTDDAAAIPRERVGRALLRRGPGSIVAFQCAHVSGVAPEVQHAALTLLPVGVAPPVRTASIGTRRDLDVLVEAITDAHRTGGFSTPARPWSDPLPGDITLAALWAAADATDAADEGVPGSWPFGLLDEPHAQRHTIAAWRPTTGHLLVAGMAGSGTSTALCTVAATALREHEGGPPDVYVIATSVAPYAAFAEFDAVGGVLTVDDDERVRRLLRVLGERVDAHRRGHGAPVPALVLVDGIGALRAAHDSVAGLEVLDALERVAADGAGCGVHFAFACEHPAALGHRLDRTIAHRVLLRLPDRHDYASTGLRDLDPRTLAPGSGIDAASGLRVQIAHARPADLVPRSMASRTGRRRAPQVRVLPDRVTVHDLPAATVVGGVLHLPLAIGDTDLTTIGPALRDHEHVLVTGPARSGRTTVLDVAAHVARAGGLAVMRVTSPRSGAGGGLIARDEIADALDVARHAAHRTLVLVDDADQVDDGGALERLVAAADHRITIVAAVRNDRLRSAYRHWTTELRRGGHGVLLRVDDADGDLLGVRLPRGVASRVAGRGWLVRDGDVERAQFACIDPAPVGPTVVAP